MAGRTAQRMLGSENGKLAGRALLEVIPPDSEPGRLLERALHTRTRISEQVVQMPTPDHRRLSISCEPLNSAEGEEQLGMLITMHDPEAGGQIEAELGIAQRLAALSRVTRGVAHEIKNPLNAITLHLEVLRGRLEEPAPEVEVISREIARLDRVVKMFLDFNRPVEPEIQHVDLSGTVAEIERLISPEAKKKGISVQSAAKEPAIINADVDLLNQAILNVVMNALDAMPGGGTLTIEVHKDGGLCEVSVADTGPGIPEEVQDRIFSLYFSTKKQGSGIGLALAYRFVQLLDGRLEFSSQAGVGTTFRFTFPEAISASRPANLVLSRSHGA
jgi:signal transduction histidine kinase